MITGQIITRDKGLGPTGERIVMVVGILCDPDGRFADGHQYTLVSSGISPNTLTIVGQLDVTKAVHGLDASGMLCSPLWRV